MKQGAMAILRWGAALVALTVAAVVAMGALAGTGGDRPAPIDVAGSAVPGGGGELREVDAARLQPAEPGPGTTPGEVAPTATMTEPTATTAGPGPTGPTGATTTTLVPGLGTVTDPATDPLAALLAPLPLVGTTTTTTGPGATTTTTLLPGLPPLPLPPLPALPLLPPVGG